MGAILRYLMMYAIIRAVVALGFGVVTYGAVMYALYRAINEAKIAYNSLPGELLNFLAIAGVIYQPDGQSFLGALLIAKLNELEYE